MPPAFPPRLCVTPLAENPITSADNPHFSDVNSSNDVIPQSQSARKIQLRCRLPSDKIRQLCRTPKMFRLSLTKSISNCTLHALRVLIFLYPPSELFSPCLCASVVHSVSRSHRRLQTAYCAALCSTCIPRQQHKPRVFPHRAPV
jgi:hypothetical protein